MMPGKKLEGTATIAEERARADVIACSLVCREKRRRWRTGGRISHKEDVQRWPVIWSDARKPKEK